MESDIDRAEELRVMKDIWPLLCVVMNDGQILRDSLEDIAKAWSHANSDPEYLATLESKYRKGEQEYNRQWLSMTKDELFEEIDQELADLLIYRSMISLRFAEIVIMENGEQE